MKKVESNKYAILILAAGTSSRLGRPKQLVKFGNGNLLSHTINAVSSISNADVHIILGAYSKEICTELSTCHSVHINPDWDKGMGNTIAFGVNQITNSGYEAVILTVCDHPYLEPIHFEQLIHSYEDDSKSDIIISKYKSGNGPPTLFDVRYFQSLSLLDGDNGAKVIVHDHFENVDFITFEKGDIDVDTEEDLNYL